MLDMCSTLCSSSLFGNHPRLLSKYPLVFRNIQTLEHLCHSKLQGRCYPMRGYGNTGAAATLLLTSGAADSVLTTRLEHK